MEEYTFANSSSLDMAVHVKIGSLDGYQTPVSRSTLLRRADLRHVGSNLSAHSDLYVTAQLWADSKPLTVPVQTAYKAFKSARAWNQWLQLPLSLATLPLSAQLAITVWDLSPTADADGRGHSVPFGGTTVRLFGKDDTLQKGRQRCRIHRHKAADGFSSSTTPADPPQARRVRGARLQQKQTTEQERELERLEAVFKKHEMGEIPRVDWLDRLVFEEVSRRQQEVERVNNNTRRRRKKSGLAGKDGGEESSNDDDDDKEDERFTLTIEFPRFNFPVVFTDHEYKPTPVSAQPQQTPNGSVNLKPPPEVQYGPGIQGAPNADDKEARIPPLVRVYDPEVGARDNPAESKHRRLVRSHRTGVLDRDLRPNAKIRDELNTIMGYGPTQELNSEEKDLVWKFRHHLTREKRALTKFIKSVNWRDQSEVRQAIQILPRWTEIDIDDALELLGPTFDHPSVRAYAVDRLRKADDEELLLYLLQLVQALKFEKRAPPQPAVAAPATGDPDTDATGNAAASSSAADSSLASFLISRATQSFLLGNYLHWYLMVECDDSGGAGGSSHRELFARVSYDFMTALEATPEGSAMRKTLLRQAELVTLLTRLSGELQKFGAGQRQKMVSHARAFLADPKNGLVRFEAPLPLPLDPRVMVTGIVPEETMVFKSSLHPMLLHFRTAASDAAEQDEARAGGGRRRTIGSAGGGTYPVLFKKGDDLRQDQLVIQIISLMDRLLRKENLDLKLSPFRVLATSASAGAAQFVPSITLQAAKTKYGGNYVLEYLRANNPDKAAEYGVRRETMENYVKSVAGYSVVTYLLGVGDRHLDNLLLAPDGHFFHIDFGYILGRDPKPAPPPIKITLAMLDGMGGSKSANFALFQQHCFTAYLALRKQSSLILNLFSLMQDADIPDIRVEPDKVVEKVRERFRLEVGEEEAMREFGRLVEDSLSRIVPLIVDGIHEWVQRYRG